MKKITLLFSFLFYSFFSLSGQSAFDLVYNIFQSNCNNCHGNAAPQGGLDLEGSGTTADLKKLDVYNNLVNITPANTNAAAAGLKLVERGRADLSFLFQKINKGLDTWIEQEPNTGQGMPLTSDLTDIEKETIRQWILYGADRTGKKFDEEIFEKFYTEGGNVSFPDGPPTAPAAGEGFQIKVGPFYLNESGKPQSELEFFTKYALNLPSDLEINRLDIKISPYSHHMIVYNFEDSNGSGIPDGLRLEADHSDIGLVAAVQEPTDLKLPDNTAFKWKKDLVLDLNAHYINYSPQGIYRAEAYINIYTQPTGTAAQEMFTELIVNGNIPIPNDGELITHTDVVNSNFGELFVWGLMGHTHKYGKNYKVYRRKNFQQNEMIYDAACPRGIPGCSTPFFDYRHIPIRYFEPLEPLLFNFANGLIHEAQWVNNGPSSVNFGPTSNDEMMVLVAMFTTDTTGLDVSSVKNTSSELPGVEIFPTPAREKISVRLPEIDNYTLKIFDLTGKNILSTVVQNANFARILTNKIPNGFYLLNIENSEGKQAIQKIFIQKE